MKYRFNLLDKRKSFVQRDYSIAVDRLSSCYKSDWKKKYSMRLAPEGFICIEGDAPFEQSGAFVEGLVLNMLVNLQQLGYVVIVLSREFGYGNYQEWEAYSALTEKSVADVEGGKSI